MKVGCKAVFNEFKDLTAYFHSSLLRLDPPCPYEGGVQYELGWQNSSGDDADERHGV